MSSMQIFKNNLAINFRCSLWPPYKSGSVYLQIHSFLCVPSKVISRHIHIMASYIDFTGTQGPQISKHCLIMIIILLLPIRSLLYSSFCPSLAACFECIECGLVCIEDSHMHCDQKLILNTKGPMIFYTIDPSISSSLTRVKPSH